RKSAIRAMCAFCRAHGIFIKKPHPERACARLEGWSLASWFETRGGAALLTMRVWQTSSLYGVWFVKW
ncbi:MAG: hypothetical protein ABI407_05540, partial [Bradyrhizobium sp.]